MEDTGVEAEISRPFVQQIVQDPAVAAVAVDDRQIARRQRAHDGRAPCRASAVDKARDRKRQRARAQSCSRDSPIEMPGSCQRSNSSPQRSTILRVSAFGHDHIGVERQMRPVLLDRAERPAEDRGGIDLPGGLGRRQSASARRSGAMRRATASRRRPVRSQRARPGDDRACGRRASPWRSCSGDCPR